MLPVMAKQDVNATQLSAIVAAAWSDTIAGEVADGVREKARASVERVLIDLCSVRRSALAALLGTLDGGLDALLMAKLRDEFGSQGVGHFGALASDEQVEATEQLRRFLSIFYYHFPDDDLVRTGDIVACDGDSYAMVFSPQCLLERFRGKTGGRLTLYWRRGARDSGPCGPSEFGGEIERGWRVGGRDARAGWALRGHSTQRAETAKRPAVTLRHGDSDSRVDDAPS